MSELKKNQIYTCKIDSWASDGSGVCRVGDRAVFVKGAIPGEIWELRIVKVGKSAAYGKGERLIESSPYRAEPDCAVFGRCGGCGMRHLTYEGELMFKLQRVNDAYKHIGGLELRASEIIGAESVTAYRNKAVYAISDDCRCGFFQPRSHRVIPVERCLIQSGSSDAAARAVTEFMRENKIPAYDETTGKGLVRHVFTRTARDGALQVTVVANGGFGDKTQALTEYLRSACPETVGIILNVNKSRGNTVLSGQFHTLWGKSTIHDRLCGLDFELSPAAFYQVNPVQAEKLYSKTLELAAPEGKGLVLDLYCGAGTISLCLARGAERVIGAEIVPEAVENAGDNAARNGIDNVEFICADAGQTAAELLKRGERPDAVVVDPPRKGLSTECIDAVCLMEPERLVYVSCDVSTQARDLKLFRERGYEASYAAAVDMFPRTRHVETVCLLTRHNRTRDVMEGG